MPLQVSAQRVIGPSSSANVVVARAVATAVGGTPAVSGGGAPAWPTAATTGATGTLTPNTSQFLGTNGATYTNQNFTDTGTITIAGSNMTFTNCKFSGKAAVSPGADGTSLTDCTFDAGATGVSMSSLSISTCSNITVTRAKIMNFTDDAIHVTSDNPPPPSGTICTNIVIQDSFISGANVVGGAHIDGLQVRGSSNLQLLNCWIDTSGAFNEFINSAIFFEEDNGGNSGFLVDGCYLKGTGYTTAYLNTGSGTVSNNTFDKGPSAAYFFNDGLGGDAVSDGIAGTGNVNELGNPLSLHPS